MKVSVIVPLYNHAAFVGEALASLLAQKDDCNLDILVIDDGSTDDGPAVVAALAAKHPEIRMLRTANQGVTRTRNVGLGALPADCAFVTFADSDDVSPAGRLRSDLAEFKADPDLDFTFGKVLAVDRIDPDTLRPAAAAKTAEIRNVHLAAAIFRKAFVDRIGRFDESFDQSEDTDYLLRAFESGARYKLTETFTVYYRQHGGNMTRRKDVLQKFLVRALRQSLVRRRRNPAAQVPSEIFDLHALREAGFE